MEELIRKSDAIKNIDELWTKWRTDGTGHIQAPFAGEATAVECCKTAVLQTPAVEPNLILPERMERGDCYEVGETIVVMMTTTTSCADL